MGGIFSSILGGTYPADVFIDFENAEPTSGEEKVWSATNEVLLEGEQLITEIKDYKGCGDLQRAAMKGNSEAERACFDALLERVAGIHRIYLFANKLNTAFPVLLSAVITTDDEGKETLSSKQALAKQVGGLIDFAIRFDSQRMMTPDLSNDFSYYRRLLPKFSSDENIVVDSDEASAMAMFTAQPLPMINALAKAGGAAASQNDHVEMGLAVLANSCCGMIRNKSFTTPATNLFCARAMTGAIVLYDHIAEMGVFHKKSPVQLRACINVLKNEFPREGVGLMSSIRYSTVNFRTAPSSIQGLFD